jgi:predicted glycosyltransferase
MASRDYGDRMMKIWIDMLTPKQVLFFYPLAQRLRKEGHRVLMTSRDYREATGVIKARKFKGIKIVGKYGGGSLVGKLDAENKRNQSLFPIITKFKPDVAIGSASPNMTRISFALGIKILLHSNTPHADKTMRLSVPLADHLVIPKHIPKEEFIKYGISKSKITQYNAMDEVTILKENHTDESYSHYKRYVVLRTAETKASYFKKQFDIKDFCLKFKKVWPNYDILVLPRYAGEAKQLSKHLGKLALVANDVLDSAKVINGCALFIGSGGTMTTEAVLRGKPTISLNLVPNLDEEHLVKSGLLLRARSASGAIKLADFAYSKERMKKVIRFLDKMDDPHDTFIKILAKL